MSDQTSRENNSDEFDLFAPTEDDHLQEFLNKGKYKWTNKFTSVLAFVLLILGSASAGAWYGYKQGQNSAGSIPNFANFGNARSSFGSNSSGNNNFGGFTGGNNSNRNGRGASATGGNLTQATPAPTTTGKTLAGNKSTTARSSASARPSIAGAAGGNGGNGQRRGGFADNPEMQACLKKAGVTLDENGRANFQDTKVRDALQSCAQSLGITFGGGQRQGAPGTNGGNNGGSTNP